MPTLNIHGQTLHYSANVLDSDAPAVVLVHGAGGNSRVWPYAWSQINFVRSPRARRWLTDFPLYLVDLPGHGRSDPPGRSRIDDYAKVVINFAEALGLSRYVVGGHSMGGAIAQTVGLRQPDGLAGLVLLGTGATMPVTDLILGGLLSDFEKTVRLIMKFSWQKEAAESFTDVAMRHMLATPPDVVHGDFLACSRFDVRDRLGEIDVPTLVIGGENDRMMPMPNSQFLAERIPNATLVQIANAGHFMMTEKTNRVTRSMVQFLNGLG